MQEVERRRKPKPSTPYTRITTGHPMNTDFRPAWWLPGPHLQTLWNPFCRKPPQLERQRERLWLDDGDFLDLDWHGPHDAHAPLVLVTAGEFPARLRRLLDGLTALIVEYRPDEVAIEKVFMARNPDSALKLGQARGVVLLAASVLVQASGRRGRGDLVLGQGTVLATA